MKLRQPYKLDKKYPKFATILRMKISHIRVKMLWGNKEMENIILQGNMRKEMANIVCS